MDNIGYLACEVCGFRFDEKYGTLGEYFIDCHHIEPIHLRSEIGSITKLTDLALLCSNCHRMIHKSSMLLTIADLKAVLKT